MTKYAKIVNDKVVEVLDALDGRIHPALHGDYVQVPDTVTPGMVKDGRKFVPPEPVAPADQAEAVAAASKVVSRVDFLRRFTRSERIALREAEHSDPVIGDSLLMLNLAEQVDLSGGDVVEGLAYLEKKKLLSSDRRKEIIAG